ncbi:Cysteine-rich and transmembrane domain-containing protein [Lachancea thermotolerans]|uniref:KLTH0E15840p n=1 Tax=Lachancea thermotolerans (strain ATCC 56472 / CBS 6340 / NRRL Y-8284) TaxID=559295 RepID=C5DIX1_LACTC|nr:KLTH0E15840p [Lachancea thermotolerans CBS 6340]CAR23732.1 KLTH0E15840p [Lachancea thermotolerans CBS 6340]
MSAAEYYKGTSESKQQYTSPAGPPPGAYQDSRGFGSHFQNNQPQQAYYGAQQQQYYANQPPQYNQQQHYQQPGYYNQQQPIYVQQQRPTNNNSDCLTACLAGMCLCCTLDMLF